MTRAIEGIAKTLRTIAWCTGTQILKPTRTEIKRYGISGLVDQKLSIGLVTDLVTRGDTKSEQYITREVLNLDSDLTIIGEEEGRRQGLSTIAVIFDPLDGSETYAGTLDAILDKPENRRYREQHNVRLQPDDFDKYTVHIMYLIHNRVVIDATYSPDRNILTWAVEDEGAWMCDLNAQHPIPEQLHASRKQIFKDSVISDSYVPSKLTESYTNQYKPILDALARINTHFRRFGYTSAVYEALSTTFRDNHPDARALYIGPHVYLWDVPILTLREAGADALVIREEQGKFRIGFLDIKDFRIYDPISDKYKEPFFVVIGEREMLRRLDQKFFGDLPRR